MINGLIFLEELNKLLDNLSYKEMKEINAEELKQTIIKLKDILKIVENKSRVYVYNKK